MKVVRLLLKLLSALFGLYLILGGLILVIAAPSQSDADSQTALRIVSGCFIAASLPLLVAVASTRKATILGALLLVPASIAFLFLTFNPSLQPDTRVVGLPTVQVEAISFAILLLARIADGARTARLPAGT